MILSSSRRSKTSCILIFKRLDNIYEQVFISIGVSWCIVVLHHTQSFVSTGLRSYQSTRASYRLPRRRSAFPIIVGHPELIMRFDADWMSRADDRILEHLFEQGPDTPKGMADSGRVRFSRQYINQRCKKLVSYGLLLHLGNGVYAINHSGEQYLRGELDVSVLDPDERDGL